MIYTEKKISILFIFNHQYIDLFIIHVHDHSETLYGECSTVIDFVALHELYKSGITEVT